MLRVVSHKSAAGALTYYTQGLSREDYYSEGQEIRGKWHGLAADWLGLHGDVTKEAFAALVENRHPETGERLTPRTKHERIVGYDLNFHAPKSLSLLHALTNDDDIVTVFRAAVAETMEEIESKIATRVRQKGAQQNRVTGNFAWAEFVHFTARPVDGIPDPLLHVHAFTMNATFDPVEERWKAANFRDIKADAPYSEAVFHSLLTAKLVALGYEIEQSRFGWEIAGIPRTLVDKFSRRTAQIEKLAAEKGITSAKAKDALGAATRESKRKGLTHADLLAAWNSWLTPEERKLISEVRSNRGKGAKTERITAAKAMDEACEKHFAKNSVVASKQIIREALRFGFGSVTPEAAWQEFAKREFVVKNIKGRDFCTSIDVLAEEIALINFVRSGRGIFRPLVGRNLKFHNEKLSDEQRKAARHLLTSHDQVMVLTGKAGVGKTTLMREVVDQIRAAGIEVFAFAPSASASRETLREAGFENAETVAHLLANTKLQAKLRGNVIWIDEASLLGTRDQWRVMQLAKNSAWVILSGDTAQHAPVARGDAFRLLQKYAGLKIAEVTKIRRQEPENYRKAVEALSVGNLRVGFRHLDELGAILEVKDETERYRQLAQEFLELGQGGEFPLVVSPTHAEGFKVTTAIRSALKDAGRLGAERAFIQYHNLQWEEPDRRFADNYHKGLVVQFHQNAKGIRRGAMFCVTGRDKNGIVHARDEAGIEKLLPLEHAGRFQVFEEREINLARGDRIRITRNGKSDDGRRLNNGNVFAVEKFTRDGKIVLDTGAILNARHGHLAHGFCQTSHSSQSKTVRDVLVAQSANSFLASSREGFYVSCSRGRQTIRIFTDNRQGLQEAVGNSSLRRAGIELAGFTNKEVSSLMSAGQGAKQWREMIHSRTAEGAAKTHVRNLLKERKQEGPEKPKTVDFREYVAMRRRNAGPDGKSRSKGYSGGEPQKKGDVQNRRRSFLRPSELTTSTKEKIAEAKKPKPAEQKKPAEPSTRQNRLAKGYAAAKEHFRNAVARTKSAFDSATQGKRRANLPQGSPAHAAKHAVKQRSVDVEAKTKQHTKVQQKAPAPVIRRGR